MSEKLRVENLRYSIGPAEVIRGVSFSLNRGDALIITGASGSGKSVLLELAAGLITPREGSVWWNGVDISQLNKRQLLEERRRTGFMFQKHALIQNFAIFDNIALPLRYHRTAGDVEERVRYLMKRLGITGMDRRLPESVPASQARCAAFARALALEPELLFLDEPESGLDAGAMMRVVDLLQEVQQTSGAALLIATHSEMLCRVIHGAFARLDGGSLSIAKNGQMASWAGDLREK